MRNKTLMRTLVGAVIVGSMGSAAVVGASSGKNTEGTPAITAEQALQLALQKTEGFVHEVELSFEEDDNYYEIEIESNVNEYVFNIDAATGEIVGQETEPTVENEEQVEGNDSNHSNDNNYPNVPADITSFEEYNTIMNKVNAENLSFHLVTDNQGNRIMFLVDENGNKHYKTIFIKYNKQLEIIDVKNGGQVYYGTI